MGTDSVLLGAWAETAGASHVLDIGTGTGVLALMLAQRLEQTSKVDICALDIQREACICAKNNFSRSPWAGRLKLIQQSVQSFAETAAGRFELIVSNPPFFSETTVSPNESRRINRNPVALSINDLLVSVDRLLSPEGRFCAVLPVREGQRLQEHGALMGLYCTRVTHVRSRREKPVERLLVQLERDPYRFSRTYLTILEQGQMYSAPFQELTSQFYII